MALNSFIIIMRISSTHMKFITLEAHLLLILCLLLASMKKGQNNIQIWPTAEETGQCSVQCLGSFLNSIVEV